VARRVITLIAFLLWAGLAFLTLFVLFTSGPDVLVLLSLLVLAVLGMGVFGALGEKRRPGGDL
jgi:hypothetical protein